MPETATQEARKESGFTLIELMVVVLIIAILLAIAIPTFLGARNTANARAAQSDLRNALTAEQTYWTNNQQFSSTPSDLMAVEESLNWTTGAAGTTVANQVGVATGDNGNAVMLEAQGKDDNCYFILQSDDPNNSFTGYGVEKGACTAPAVPGTLPTSITSGSASANRSAAGAVPSTFYTGW